MDWAKACRLMTDDQLSFTTSEDGDYGGREADAERGGAVCRRERRHRDRHHAR